VDGFLKKAKMQNCRLAIALYLPMGVAFAQTAGSITGGVKDQSGAVAPDAAVTVTNSETNVARSTVTNAAGIYSFPDLTPGLYQIKVAAAGFATVVKTNIDNLSSFGNPTSSPFRGGGLTGDSGSLTESIPVAALTEPEGSGAFADVRRPPRIPTNSVHDFDPRSLSQRHGRLSSRPAAGGGGRSSDGLRCNAPRLLVQVRPTGIEGGTRSAGELSRPAPGLTAKLASG
jgi:hypothetical protein